MVKEVRELVVHPLLQSPLLRLEVGLELRNGDLSGSYG